MISDVFIYRVRKLKKGVQHRQRSWSGESYDVKANYVYKAIEFAFQTENIWKFISGSCWEGVSAEAC